MHVEVNESRYNQSAFGRNFQGSSRSLDVRPDGYDFSLIDEEVADGIEASRIDDVSASSYIVKPLSVARTKLGERRVLARLGWVGVMSASFNIQLIGS